MLTQAIYDVGCGCISARKRGNMSTGSHSNRPSVIEGVILVIGVLHPINDRVVHLCGYPIRCKGDILGECASKCPFLCAI